MRMGRLGLSRPTFFDAHGEVNTDKTIELARARAEELASGTSSSPLRQDSAPSRPSRQCQAST
jgi:hypothetical protein